MFLQEIIECVAKVWVLKLEQDELQANQELMKAALKSVQEDTKTGFQRMDVMFDDLKARVALEERRTVDHILFGEKQKLTVGNEDKEDIAPKPTNLGVMLPEPQDGKVTSDEDEDQDGGNKVAPRAELPQSATSTR
ncbi:unnamed protein product [Linum trigynum]|uniref:Uncharacterized protein n=1 Tax=Linum trigynum TaxID=586398 RepID=A0AAV2G8Z7_9ROSI